ncbi:hypothetical protein [Massilia suwonensis]|uniref:Zinc-binding domain-containing protein n=1 Tax=Massilia suwonensis TaxID=648895 RepID=A0ABW0MJ40_9BURK
MFVGSYTSARLSLTTPPDCCCNCGAHGPLEFVDTPMKQVRFFLVFGTELTLTEAFPYCADCKRSAKRVRHGWLAKGMVYCLVTSIVFLAVVIASSSLPRFMGDNLFYSALVLSALLTAGYYATRKSRQPGGTYYQPVALTEAWIGGQQLAQYGLAFHNERYAGAMRRANAELIDAGILKIA